MSATRSLRCDSGSVLFNAGTLELHLFQHSLYETRYRLGRARQVLVRGITLAFDVFYAFVVCYRSSEHRYTATSQLRVNKIDEDRNAAIGPDPYPPASASCRNLSLLFCEAEWA